MTPHAIDLKAMQIAIADLFITDPHKVSVIRVETSTAESEYQITVRP